MSREYNVAVPATLVFFIKTEADSSEEAKQKVIEKYHLNDPAVDDVEKIRKLEESISVKGVYFEGVSALTVTQR